MREHAGDSLYEIAREEALNPSTVRQRICRLRQKLRTRYLWPLLMVIGLGSSTALLVGVPTGSTTTHTRSPLAPYVGAWRVVGVAPSHYAAKRLEVSITPNAIRVFSATESLGRELELEKFEGGQVTLRSGSSRWVATLTHAGKHRLKLTSPRGYVELERVE